MAQYDLAEVAGLYGLPQQIEEVLDPGPASALAVNPWGTLLAIGRPDGGVTIFDLQTRGLAATWPSSSSSSSGAGGAGVSRVTALLWSASGRALLSGAADGSVTAWDVLAGSPVHRWGPLGGSAVVRLAWAGEQQRQEANEGLVLVSMAAAPAHLLCLASGQARPLPVLSPGGDASSNSSTSTAAAAGQVAVASPDGDIIYAGGRGVLLVLRRSDLALLDACRVGKGQQVLDLQLHGRRLLVTTADTTARVYRAYRPGEQRTSRRQARQTAAAQQAAETQQAAALAPAEWQTHALSEAEAAARAAKQRNANSLFYDDSTAWLTLHLTLTNTLEKQPLRCVALSPDGEYFAAAHGGAGSQVLYLWECEAEARLNETLEGPKDEAAALCWHPSHAPKQLLVLGQSGKIYIWAKVFIENWSAFAPEFKELSSNDEYHELEDEFDLNPRAEGAGPAADDEEDEVDIGSGGGSSTQQPAPPASAANPLAGPPLLHLPLQLLSPRQQAAAGKPAARQQQQQRGQEGQQQRMDIGPRVAATKLHGPDAGLSYREATEPTRGVMAAAEPPLPPQVPPEQAGAAVAPSQAAPRPTEGRLPDKEASRPAMAAGQDRSQQQAGDVLRLRGGMQAAPAPAATQPTAASPQTGATQDIGASSAGGGSTAIDTQPNSAYLSPHMRTVAAAEQVFAAVEAPVFGRVSGQLAAAQEQARVAELKTGEAVQEARVWARVKAGAEAEKEEARHIIQQANVELDRSERLAGLASDLQQQLAANGNRQGKSDATSGPAGRARGSLPTSPRSPSWQASPQQRAARLARQAADLEEESKRVEAQACYLRKEAEQLGELARQKKLKADELELEAVQMEQVADELERSVAAALEEAQAHYQAAEEKQREAGQLEQRMSQLKSEAYQLVKEADVKAARAELHLPEAEKAAQHAETARSAFTQARRDAQLLSQRSQQLTADAEKKMAGAAALAQRAFEKAQESFEAKKAALEAQEREQGQLPAAAGPTTPEVAPQPAQRLASELERLQRGRAAAELHASQLMGQAHERVAHASRLEHSAERSAQHVRRVLADAAQARAQEEEALERAQRAGEAASSLAGERMAEQWIALTGTPEWRTLATRFPDTIRQLSAAAAGGGDGAGSGTGGGAEWLGSSDGAGGEEAA